MAAYSSFQIYDLIQERIRFWDEQAQYWFDQIYPDRGLPIDTIMGFHAWRDNCLSAKKALEQVAHEISHSSESGTEAGQLGDEE